MNATAAAPLRVAIVDAVDVRRRALTRLITEDTATRLAGEGTTGRDALALVNTRPVDVLLIGTAMPEMDGLTTLRVLRATSQIPVVILAEEIDVESMLDAISLGATGYLSLSSLERGDTIGIGYHLTALLAPSGERVTEITGAPAGPRATLVTEPAGRVAGLAEILRTGGLPIRHAVYAIVDGPAWLVAPLARRLYRNTAWRVLAAHEGDALTPGHALVASLSASLVPVIDGRRLRLVRRSAFTSLADAVASVSAMPPAAPVEPIAGATKRAA